jgi:hypothetical protein
LTRKSAAVFVVTLFVTLALALVPASLGGKPSGGTSSAWVSVSPNPAPAGGSRVDVTGCGYEFAPAEIRIVHSAGTEAYMDAVWNTGCLNPTFFLTREAGTYTVSVYQTGGTKRHPTQVLKASTTLTVE